ncbi:DnaJ domain-containing protein [Desulfonispora thiosulfatigenes DSM 11270]|uniref:DnaJ domain-containing protein n=1 Tax=Desulfonispora thiosulfatigenes DSM 11270 TaxID=656914 RepID=A0A1W1UI82_DESTI|nr:DnaJ domain-containing protein [Desulfonispora thiosulfatigenes]SMB80780.1 DnaJ domain-containing protein [Desulfonispora thiosulfatigenes DSM 11270]
MSLIKKIIGKAIYVIAKALDVLMDSLIQIIETMVSFIISLTKSITKGCFALLSMGGCLIVLLFASSLTIRVLMDPFALFIVVFLLAFPVLGTRLVSYLKYLKYITTEFLFNLANYLMDQKKYQYKAFNEYKVAYKKAEEERRREEQRHFYEQQRKREEQFKQQWYQQNSQRWQGSYGNYSGYGDSYINPSVDLKTKYKKSCDILGVPYDADKEQFKMAYRKKAKEYHPDLNKDPDAAKKFQEIKDAYEFLNDNMKEV